MAPGGRAALVVTLAAMLGGCASRQILGEDGSVSFGPSNAGALLGPAELPPDGVGYTIPAPWRQRGLRYGTDELVAVVQEVGRSLAVSQPGRTLVVADLSLARGGPSSWHRSHQTGRDVDLVFFVRDLAGQPLEATAMRRFDADGRSVAEQGEAGKPLPGLVFDDAANWALVRALIENPIAEVQYVFILDDLKQRLLEYAEASGEPARLIAAASYLLQQPGDSLPHDDHMHVRVLCSGRDRSLGCQDAGATQWRKKGWKYDRAPGLWADGTATAAVAAPADDLSRAEQ